MRKLTHKLDFYSDPGHGWLRVDRDILDSYGVKDKITHYSYQYGTWVYLEEDCDAPIFLDAVKSIGNECYIKEHHTNKNSMVRSFEPYQPTPGTVKTLRMAS